MSLLSIVVLITLCLLSVAGVLALLLSARRHENRRRVMQIKPSRVVDLEHALGTTQKEYRALDLKHKHSKPVVDFAEAIEETQFGAIRTRDQAGQALVVTGTVNGHLAQGNLAEARYASSMAERMLQEVITEADGVAGQLSQMMEGRGHT